MKQAVLFAGQHYTPGKIICVGRNYVAHIEELGNEMPEQMVVFNKPASAITQTLQARLDEPLHYEGEIALLVKEGSFVAAAFGFDLTKRALQSTLKAKGLPWERAKAFDGAALFSEFVAIAPAQWDDLSLSLQVDGAVRQQGGVALMMFPPARILEELTRYTSLQDGDIVMTGTPAGVGELVAGSNYHGQVFVGEQLLVEARWQAQH